MVGTLDFIENKLLTCQPAFFVRQPVRRQKAGWREQQFDVIHIFIVFQLIQFLRVLNHIIYKLIYQFEN